MASTIVSKYMNIDSYVHRLDPRTKLFFSSLYMILVFLSNNIIEFLFLFLFLFLAKILSKTPLLHIFSAFKLVWFLILFTSIVQIFFNSDGEIIFSIYSFSLYSGALYSILLLTVRFFMVIGMMVIFTLTTSPTSITTAVEKSFGFLKKVGIDVASIALMMSISLRFIPTILEETNRIINAQVSRGANFRSGGLITKVRAFIPILIPIFVSTLKRADDLATAMEVRGYDPDKKRSKYKILKYEKNDYITYLLIILLSIFVIIW